MLSCALFGGPIVAAQTNPPQSARPLVIVKAAHLLDVRSGRTLDNQAILNVVSQIAVSQNGTQEHAQLHLLLGVVDDPVVLESHQIDVQLLEAHVIKNKAQIPFCPIFNDAEDILEFLS